MPGLPQHAQPTPVAMPPQMAQPPAQHRQTVASTPNMPALPAFEQPRERKKTTPGLFDMPQIDDEENELDTTFKKNRPVSQKQDFGSLFAAPAA